MGGEPSSQTGSGSRLLSDNASGTIIGVLLNYCGFNAIKLLIYAAVINGVAAVPIIFILIRISNNKKIMGAYAQVESLVTYLVALRLQLWL